MLGAEKGTKDIVLDCEKWAHPVFIKPFRMARACVTNIEWLRFLNSGGYRNESYWGYEGRLWLQESKVKCPTSWECRQGKWYRWKFDMCEPIEAVAHHPVSKVTWFEAEAYCNWAQRRLPTEAEWEFAVTEGSGGKPKRRYPWGYEFKPRMANIDYANSGTVPVDRYPQGDTPSGVRQMIGNVWEWTSTTLYPYPGFQLDYPYRENSAFMFGDTKVARGGAWNCAQNAAHGLCRQMYHLAGRREAPIGLRTCALDTEYSRL